MFTRNGFEKLDSAQLGVEVRMDISVSVREAAGETDFGGDQGTLKCNCSITCKGVLVRRHL